ncbi:MAG: transcriptional repressor [Phycisphaerales bacterium]|nr:transcriptional repressor [Phycisphaerales bacterium]
MTPVTKARRHTIDVQQARDAFRRHLAERRIRWTAPRQRILDVVLGFDAYFDAEQVSFALRREDHRVAKATVYRTLPLLVDCGILKQVRFDVKQAHYGLCFGEIPHDHMVCRQCGRIVEFASDTVIRLRDRLARLHRFQAVGHRFQVSGYCADCFGAPTPA